MSDPLDFELDEVKPRLARAPPSNARRNVHAVGACFNARRGEVSNRA